MSCVSYSVKNCSLKKTPTQPAVLVVAGGKCCQISESFIAKFHVNVSQRSQIKKTYSKKSPQRTTQTPKSTEKYTLSQSRVLHSDKIHLTQS